MRTPHIPSMDQIRDEFIEAWAGDFVRGEIAATQYFDQALNGHNLAIEATAEQRGAAQGWDEAMTAQVQRLVSGDPDVERFQMPDNPYRADRMEGDDD